MKLHKMISSKVRAESKYLEISKSPLQALESGIFLPCPEEVHI